MMARYDGHVESLSQDRAVFLQTVAARIVPGLANLSPPDCSRFLAIVDRALLDRPPAVRRQLGVFLGVIRWTPLLRFGAPFERLDGRRQDRVLRFLESCPVGLLRQGFWGLKAIVFMGYYGRPEAWDELGYAPRFDSREALGA